MRKVKFKNRNWDTVAHLHLPNNFDEKQNYPAIVCVHPGSMKEQTAGLYAQRLAEKGLIALAYDASFQGESGGEQRYLEDPTTRVEDIRYAVDYLTTLNFIDEKCIGLLGICAGGGYAANAAMSEKRIKAVATVVGTNTGRAFRETNFLETLKAVSSQRTMEAKGAVPRITNWTPNSAEEATNAGINELDMLEAIDYYRTSRGEHPTANNKLLFRNYEQS